MPADGHQAARVFYGTVLGMREKEAPATLDRRRLVWFEAGASGDEVHLFVEDRLGPNSAQQHLCLEVDDLAAFRARLAEHGIEMEEAQAIPHRARLFIRDPFGNLIELTQITGDYRAT